MRKLIFFAAADPRSNPGPAWSAHHFAEVAARAGLHAEVRLAGDAVRVAQPDGIEDSPTGDDLRRKAHGGLHAPFTVSLRPGCVDTREVSEGQIAGIRGVPRDLGETP